MWHPSRVPRPGWRFAVVILCLVCGASVTSVGAQDEHMMRPLNPDRAHVVIFGPTTWSVRFYGRSDVSGSPVAELTDDGLVIDRALVCPWAGGHWKGSGDGTVLGRPRPDDSYDSCVPQGFPVFTTSSQDVFGSPLLFIEVTRRRGSVVESRWNARRLFLDLRTLPVGPNGRVPGLKVNPSGRAGWEWDDAAHDVERRTRADFAHLMKDASFKAFLTDIRTCLLSAQAPDCLTPFLAAAVWDLWAMDRNGTGELTPSEFVDYVWHAEGRVGGATAWDDLRGCLTAPYPVLVYRNEVRFEKDVICDIKRQNGAWKLTAVYVSE
jgi:hypothetical protein